MLSSARPDVLVDTSVAVAFLVADHAGHEETFDALAARRLGLAGHAAFEAYSVLTRLPPPNRRSPVVVAHLLAENFPCGRFLSPDGASAVLRDLPGHGVAGGAIYDALVGASAREHGFVLATRDRRALSTYHAIGAEVEVLA